MSRHHPTVDKVITLIEPVCNAGGFDLVDVRFVMEQGWVLRVCIDVMGGDLALAEGRVEQAVDIDGCERMSREISAVLDVDDVIKQAYALEVSSPGIERPLRTAQHFTRFVGCEAKIQLHTPLAAVSPTSASPAPTQPVERRNFRGILGAVTTDDRGATRVVIRVDNTDFTLPLADIEQARLVPDWDDVMRGGSGVGRRPAAPAKPNKPSKPNKPKPGRPA